MGSRTYDTIVIGSGFGGSMAAESLVAEGREVLLLERGDWVTRGEHNWAAEGAFLRTPHYTRDTRYRVRKGVRWTYEGICACVGGPSVFYGGASFRFRERDFDPAPEIVTDSGAAWPIGYAELEPYYTRAEQLIGVAGETGVDPTEPPRSAGYPAAPSALAGASRRIADAARSLGLRPFRIPMAIAEERCVACTTCDAFACAVNAKNDLATRLIPGLLGAGLELRPNTVVTRLVEQGGRVVAVEGVDAATGERLTFRGRTVVLAAGALASPHLLLSSGLERRNPGGHTVGRYLMRHCNAMMYGVFPEPPNPDDEHHKQVAIHDYYFGDPEGRRAPAGKLGNIQQVMTPPAGLVTAVLPGPLAAVAGPLLSHLTGLLVIAEDQPRFRNRVAIDPSRPDRFGLPHVHALHRYSHRDRQARNALLRRARRILRAAGARFTVTWKVTTYSHVVGTVRMGADPATSALDENCRFRGVENLYVVDGSFMPTSAGVNPSLTIAANALRVGETIARDAPRATLARTG